MQDTKKCVCAVVFYFFYFNFKCMFSFLAPQAKDMNALGHYCGTKEKHLFMTANIYTFVFLLSDVSEKKEKVCLKIRGLSKLSSDIYLQCLPRFLHIVHCAAVHSISCILE